MTFKYISSVFAFLLLLLPFVQSAEAQKKGNPLIRNFSPQEYNAHNQVWEITQNEDGHIYAATGTGIVIFDGEMFTPVQGAPLMVTKLFTTSNGKMYYAANNVFGEIVTNQQGLPSYSHLHQKLDSVSQNFSMPWNMVEYEDALWLSTQRRLHRYSDEQLEGINPIEHSFRGVFTVNSGLFVAEANTGLLRLNKNKRLEMAAGGEAFATDKRPDFLLPFDDERVLAGSVQNGLYLYYIEAADGKPRGTLEPFSNEINEQLKSAAISDGIQLKNGDYAIATATDGVFILNKAGEWVQKIDKQSGLQSNAVHSLFEDRQGNLWIALDFGFSIAETGSPISYYNTQNGLDRVVIEALEADNQLYAATTTGLYRKDGNGFIPLPGITAAVWDITKFTDPSSGKESLLAGNNFGLFWVDEGRTRELQSTFTSSLLQSSVKPDRIYAGTTSGLYYLEKNGATFSASKTFLEVGNPVRQILEDENGGLWVATQSDGLRYVSPDFDTSSVKTYRKTEDYFVAYNASMQWIEGELFVSTITNFYKYKKAEDTFVEWRSPGLDEQQMLGIYRFHYENGTLWVGANRQRQHTTRIDSVFSTSAKASSAPFTALPSGNILSINETSNGILFSGLSGILQYSESANSTSKVSLPSPQIRSVEVFADSTYSIPPNFSGLPEVPYNRKTRFRFSNALPWFGSQGALEYRYRMQGLDSEWSAWTDNHVVEYTSLWEDEYTFAVQARNREGEVSAVAEYAFVVSPPWFRTTWAYMGFALLFMGMFYGAVKSVNQIKTRRLESFNRELEQKVEERSAEITKQNEELKRLNEEKSEFMNIATHDLRSPLTGIQGLSQLLSSPERTLSSDEVRQYGQLINDSSRRMSALINNYLNVHRIEHGNIQPNPQPISLGHTAEKSTIRFKLQAEKKKMELQVHHAKEEDPVILADLSLTEQVLDNLISNAIKYSPLSSSIKIIVGKNGEFGTVTVQDQGPGITKADQKKLYQKFSQINTKPTGNEVSTGLGLSIVKQLVEIMDGDIWCESEPGNGAAFTVKLPLASKVSA
ncbi:sensor histidine kinase [Gracilimonas mengyeensis]|uniref:histidine kinase n=1 Tax=Gracilimonas mengyeensis TaxID=1302730 RepID=A0A521DBR1_9BACT|nr:ATP-binding protein [Gracilimonas mengyeensis]SMO69149.1 Signal transduction histidine kinase [Gracilimonas mengyeensis]